MHRLGDALAIDDGHDDVAGTACGIAGCKNAGTGGVAVLIDGQQAGALLGVDTLCRGYQIAFEALAGGDNDAGAGEKFLRAWDRADLAVLSQLAVGYDNAVLADLHRSLHQEEFHAVKLGVAALILARGDLVAAVQDRDIVRALADGCAGAVHGGVAGADDGDALAEVKGLGVGEIIDRKGDIAEAFALDIQTSGSPQAGADEDALEAIAEKIVDGQGAADAGIRAETDALQLQVAIGDVVEDCVGKAEIRDAIAHDAADFITAVKNRDAVAVAGEDDRNGQSGRACADDGDSAAVERCRSAYHLIGIGRGDVIFNDRKVHRRLFDAADAVSLALMLVVADDTADRRQRVICKKHPAGVIKLAVLQQTDDLRNIGMNRAALLAARLFAPQTAVCFFHHV